MPNPIFEQIKSTDNIQEVIKSAFDIDLDISGGWGYNSDSAFILKSSTMPLMQLEHTLTLMRAHLEMSMTLPKEKRYGAINVNELHREEKKIDTKKYDIITFEISAIPEKTYEAFIEEYKAGQEMIDFDVADHFKRRKESTLIRQEIVWFDITQLLS